jgi:hypothetical protein
MTYQLQQQQRGERLPDGMTVFRLGYPSKDNPSGMVAHPGLFALSTTDKEAELQSLSVWASDFILPERARGFLGDRAPVYRLVLYLDVDELRLVHLQHGMPRHPLDVVWDPYDDPDIQGHAGITGLIQPPGLSDSEAKSKRAFGNSYPSWYHVRFRHWNATDEDTE